MKELKCPHCRHLHEHEDSEARLLPGSKCVCQGCGRRLRIVAEGGTMYCNNCDCSHECEDCVDAIHAQVVCFEYRMHNWQPTLAIDIEKCCNCYDLRRIPVPSLS